MRLLNLKLNKELPLVSSDGFGCSVALGIFDGVHLGHQSIIRKAKEDALRLNLSSVILTFENHPRSLTISNTPALITDFPTRLKLFKELGIDYVLAIKFSQDIMNMTPKEYLNKYLVNILNAQVISVGYDHHFGKNRSGNVELLKEFCFENNIQLNITEAFKIENELVSSSKIREYLQAGNVEAANKLLGRNFTIRGRVVHGQKKGREIGFPTANLKINNELIKPATGVYLAAAKAEINEITPKKYQCLVNIGHRPTFSEQTEIDIEAHLLNFSADLYDSELELEFIKRIRDEKKFNSIDELKAQIQRDINSIKV